MPTAVLSSSAPMIVGIDEAGRGALAGPIVAAACILEKRRRYPVFIGDSKQMDPDQREESYDWITKNCIFGVGSVSADIIDEIGILAANERAMQAAVSDVAKIHSELYLLVDGRDTFWFDFPHTSIIRGDESEKCIGAASIIAKVTRDRWMTVSVKEFPGYAFHEHKGYGTPEHFIEIRKQGASPLHRRSFLKKFFASLA